MANATRPMISSRLPLRLVPWPVSGGLARTDLTSPTIMALNGIRGGRKQMSATRRLRMASLGVISTLILEFIVGVVNNLYGTAPAPGKPVGLFSSGWLALHVIVGILLLLSAIMLVIRAVQ